MYEHPALVKETLTALIREMSASPALFVKNPEKEFTRHRKLPFETVVRLLLTMGGNSICKELLDAQDYDANTATTSAFVQQRDKILPFAFEFLLHEFTHTFPAAKTHRGYRLLAADGSDLHIPANPDDPDTFFQNHPDEKGYNLLHLNTLYDLCSRLYLDACLQPRRQQNEHAAMTCMVDRSRVNDRVILLADRGYESYNNFDHIERKGWNYVVRVKDATSNGILKGLRLPMQEEFDVPIQLLLTKRQTKETIANPERYKIIRPCSTFDFLDREEHQYLPFSFRVLRFKLTDDTFETVVTNLDESEFSPEEIKQLYHLRWGIETSFRALKYAVGLTNFHAKKMEYIVQEVFARLLMYNVAEMITSHVVIHQPAAQHPYQVNFTAAIHICRIFLRSQCNVLTSNVEALIRRNVLPVRPGRKRPRKVSSKSVVSFFYRVA